MATRSIPEVEPGDPSPADIERADLAMCAYMRQVPPSADEYRLALLDTATSLGQTLHTGRLTRIGTVTCAPWPSCSTAPCVPSSTHPPGKTSTRPSE